MRRVRVNTIALERARPITYSKSVFVALIILEEIFVSAIKCTCG